MQTETNSTTMIESIYVCEACGHLWSENRPPDDDPEACENCRHPYLAVFPAYIVGNLEAAEEASEEVI